MEIKSYASVGKFTATSAITKEDFDLVKKHAPEALVIKDGDGEIFRIAYVEGKSSITCFGITFGAVDATTGCLMTVNDLPADVNAGEYIADKLGCALQYFSDMEESIPLIATQIAAQRAALISSITEA